MNIFKKGQLSDVDIHRWLVELRPHAYIPESAFAISVILRARLGKDEDYYFGGVNVENIDHRLSSHGEEGAIAAMVTALGAQAEIVEVWVMGAPHGLNPGDKNSAADACVTCCGKCRQQIAARATPETKIHYFALNGQRQTTTVGAFLPDAFTWPVSVPPSKPAAALTVAGIERKLLRKGPLTTEEIESWLKSLEPVDLISQISQSIVVELDNGFYVAGTRVEDAAFIDLSAVQSAVAVAAAAFGTFRITNVWVYTCGRDEKTPPAAVHSALPLSALQVLFEFAQEAKPSLHYLGDPGTQLLH